MRSDEEGRREKALAAAMEGGDGRGDGVRRVGGAMGRGRLELRRVGSVRKEPPSDGKDPSRVVRQGERRVERCRSVGRLLSGGVVGWMATAVMAGS